MSTFYPNNPQPGDDPRVSQGQLLSNASKMNTDFAINHQALTAGGNQGKHLKIFFQNALGANPNLTAPQCSLYTKLVSSVPQLFFQNGALASNASQLTGLAVTTVVTDNTITTPWGLKFSFGSSAGGGTATFAVAFGASPYSVVITETSGTNPAVVTAVAANQFTYQSTGATIYYIAVGPA